MSAPKFAPTHSVDVEISHWVSNTFDLLVVQQTKSLKLGYNVTPPRFNFFNPKLQMAGTTLDLDMCQY